MSALRTRVAMLAEAARQATRQAHWWPPIDLSGATRAQLLALARLPLIESDDGAVKADLSRATADQLREIEGFDIRGSRRSA